jgi:hypothetical protein
VAYAAQDGDRLYQFRRGMDRRGLISIVFEGQGRSRRYLQAIIAMACPVLVHRNATVGGLEHLRPGLGGGRNVGLIMDGEKASGLECAARTGSRARRRALSP